MNKKYKVAIIGTGFIGAKSHIPAYLAQSSRCEIVACSDKREAAAKYVADRNGIENYYTDSKKMLDECKPDIVSICTPNNYHKKWSIEALKAGANVLCEKPISMTLKDAYEIYSEAEKAGKLFMPCQNDRMGERQIVRDLIQKDKLGEVYFAELECVRRRGIPNWGEFHIASKNTGGPFCDVGVHFIDSLMFFLDNPKIISVSGKKWTKLAQQIDSSGKEVNSSGVIENPEFVARTYSPDEFTVEDHSAGSIRFEGDLLVNFKFSWALNSPEFDGIRMAGTKGGLVFDKFADDNYKVYTTMEGNQADIALDIEPQHKYTHLENPGHWLLIEHMLDVLDGEVEPIINKSEALNVVSAIEAFYKSAEENREIKVSEIEKNI